MRTRTYIYFSTWGNTDFDFTPVTNGFTLTFLGGPQSITAPTDGYAGDSARLDYSVVDLDGWLTAESVSGGGAFRFRLARNRSL
jgi:hypothetical protein